MLKYLILSILLISTSLLHSQGEKGWNVPQKEMNLSSNGTSYAMIVGVSQYKNVPSQLKYADRDAQVFYNFLVASGVPAQNIRLLLNQDALFGTIWSEVGYLLDVAKRGDRVYIYFSGHGDVERKTIGHKAYLLPYDSPANGYVAGAISIPDLKDYFATLSSHGVQLIFIGDACRVGNLAGGMEGISTTAAMLQEQWQDEIKILSCQPGQLSQESKQWGDGRGLFSYELINGLCGKADRNKNNEVTLRELELYLLQVVPEEADPNQQDPMIEGSNKDFVLSKLTPEVTALASTQTTHPIASIDVNGSEELLLEGKSDSIKYYYHAFQACMDSGNYMKLAKGDWQLYFGKKAMKIQELPSAIYYYRRIPKDEENEMLLAFMKRNLAAAIMNELQQIEESKPGSNKDDPSAPQDAIIDYMSAQVDLTQQLSVKSLALQELIGMEKLKKLGYYSKVILFESINPNNMKDKESLSRMCSLLDSAIYYQPEMPLLNCMKGSYLMRMGKVDEAKKFLYRDIELESYSPTPYQVLQMIYSQQGKRDSLFYVVREYIRAGERYKEEKSTDLILFNANFMAVNNLIAFNEEDSAHHYLRKLFSCELPFTDSSTYRVMNFLVSTFSSYFKDCDEAEKYYLQGSIGGHFDGTAAYGLVECYNQSGRNEKAELFLEDLIRLGSKDYYHIALSFIELENDEKATKYLDMAIAQQPNFYIYQEINEDPDLEKLKKSTHFKKMMKKRFPNECKE